MIRRGLTTLGRRAAQPRMANVRRFAGPAAAGDGPFVGTQLPKREATEPIPEYMTVTLACPHKTLLEEEAVRLLTVPGAAGAFGATPGHVPVVCELQPGILSCYFEKSTVSGRQTHYFVAAGFCVIHPNSQVEISCTEAVSLKDLSPENVAKGLADAKAKKSGDKGLDPAESACIAIEIAAYEAISQAMHHMPPGATTSSG